MDYIVESTYTSWITYEQYRHAIGVWSDNTIVEGVFDDMKGKVSPVFFRAFKDIKGVLDKIKSNFNLGTTDLLKALKSRDFFNIFKSFGFNVKLMFKSITELTGLVKRGLLSVFVKLAKTKAIDKLRKGLITIDDLIKQHPILARVTGVAVAGILLYIWLNMTFIGDLDYDFNFNDMSNALAGTFSLADLFASPEGLMMVTLFGSGALLGLSVPWLGRTVYNLVLAIVYTTYDKNKDKKIVKDIKAKLKLERIK